mgnify:CR=1 FL=1
MQGGSGRAPAPVDVACLASGRLPIMRRFPPSRRPATDAPRTAAACYQLGAEAYKKRKSKDALAHFALPSGVDHNRGGQLVGLHEVFLAHMVVRLINLEALHAPSKHRIGRFAGFLRTDGNAGACPRRRRGQQQPRARQPAHEPRHHCHN